MRRSVQAAKYVISDFVVSSVVWLVFNLIRYEKIAVYEGFETLGGFLSHRPLMLGQIFVPFFWLFLFWLSGYYNKPFGKSRLSELFATIGSVSVGVILLFFLLVLNDLPPSYSVYYEMFFSLWALQFVGVYVPRLLITQAGRWNIKNRKWALDVLMIGAGRQAVRIADNLYGLGYNIVGFVTVGDETAGEVAEKSLGRLDSLPELMERLKVDEIVVAPDVRDNARLTEILYSLYRYKRPIKVLADEFSSFPQVKIKEIKGVPLLDITDNNFKPIEQNVKWLMDKILSALSLILLSPLFLYIAWRVKRDSPGPVFFSQERVGYMGKPFRIYKFRTMYMNAEENGPLLSREDDRRVTPFGRVMRKYRIDELPQFWNVLRGDMSLVGPRPERRYFIDRIVREAPYYYLLHNVRPGITSLGMVKYGYAGSVEQMIERLRYDILYYENMSLSLDITILIYTVKTVFTGKGI